MRFLYVRNLKNRAPVEAGAQFLQNRVFRVGWQKALKINPKIGGF